MPRIRRLLFLATVATGLLGGCNGSSITDVPPASRLVAGDRVSGDAVVRHVSLEGGFYELRTRDGRALVPRELPSAYVQDGLAVRFSGQVSANQITVIQYGTMIDLIAIERR